MVLSLVVYIFLGATIAGSFMVAALTMGLTTAQPVIWPAVAGFVVAVPLAWVVARRLRSLG